MAYQFSKISVLVVESNNAMFNLASEVLRAFGIYDTYSAFSVEEGFEKFCEINPDLIIIDWLDNTSSGVELTKKIRNDKKSPNPFVPIIMMTGFSQKRRVMMARDSGITEFIVKPYTARALYDKIEAIVENPREFVKCETFFGPDRRRNRDDKNFSGQDRRRRSDNDARTDTPEQSIEQKADRAKPSHIARSIKDKIDKRDT